MTLLDVKNVKKVYTTRFGGNKVEALRNVNFSVEEGEYVAIMGESGRATWIYHSVSQALSLRFSRNSSTMISMSSIWR